MRQVVPPFAIVCRILGEQKADAGAPYRLTVHCLRIEQPEDVLLYHTLTGELLLLSHEEAALLEQLPGPVPTMLAGLVPGRFLVPVATDDLALASQTRQIAEHFWKEKTPLTRYTILTTTACNARCFYCFETGWQRSTMTEQTARDTAQYIAAHCGGQPVHIRWFGGEPLVNVRAIDTITGCLRRQGVVYRSNMTSNGYLFDEALVRRAKDDWNLQLVEITLDGTEDVYNQRKAYVNTKGSPYQRVLRNIGLLLDAGVTVKVRLNMDRDNARDLSALVDELAERFAGEPGFGIYLSVLWENTGSCPSSYTAADRHSYAEKARALRSHIEQNGIMARERLKRKFAANSCGASSRNSTTVTPDGKLGRCESCKDGAIWGSIYSDQINEDMFRSWQERKPPEDACQACAVYPQCIRLKNCPGWPEHCSPIEQSRREDTLRRAVLSTYEDWKAAGQS